MAVLLVENLKLVIVFLLIGSVIGLSKLGGGKSTPAHRQRMRKYGRPAAAHL